MAHPSAFGLICPVETPDDDNIGLVKALASSARTSSPCAADWIPAPKPTDKAWRLVINGVRKGPVDVSSLFDEFRKARLAAATSAETDEARFAIMCVTAWAHSATKEIRVWSDAGRLVRPLLLGGKTYCVR
jgi:DNA-directed RNA polymerase beta subunit